MTLNLADWRRVSRHLIAGCRPQAILLSEIGIICQHQKYLFCIELELVMATRNVVLTPHQDQVIHDLVQSGRYQNASEVMREGLRLLEQRVAEDAAKIQAPRQATSITSSFATR